MKFRSILLLLLSIAIHSEAATERPPIYAVWDIEVQEAYGYAGKKLRIATIATRGGEDFPIGAEVVFGDETLKLRDGSDLGQDGLGYFDKLGLKPGPPQKFVIDGAVQFHSLFQFDKFELRPVAGAKQVKYTKQLVKICTTKLVSNYEKYWAKKSYGIAELPVRLEKVFTRIDVPKCYQSSDRVFEQGQLASSPQVAQQIVLAKKEDDAKDLELRRREFALSYVRKIKKQAVENIVPFEVSGDKATSVFQKRICVHLLPLMRVLGVARIDANRTSTEIKSNDGFSHVRRGLKGSLVFANGKIDDVSHRFYEASLLDFESFSFGGAKCLIVKLNPEPADLYHHEKDLYRAFENILEKETEARALAEALAKVR